jgi:hypothetical protein
MLSIMGTKGFLFGYINFEKKKKNYQEYFIVNYINSINASKKKNPPML